jgi:hypothetical protein
VNGVVDTMQAIHMIDTPPGPAGRWLIERLVALSDTFKAPTKQVSKPTSGRGRRKSQRSAPVRRPRR